MKPLGYHYPIPPYKNRNKYIGIEGLEPSLTASKTGALPLGHIPLIII
jgi:hypothetical protein